MNIYKLKYFCEFDKYAAKAYCAIHNVEENRNLGDITKVDETKLEPFSMIVGGSPCQDFSIAGKQKGSVWTCKECSKEYNPLTVHWSERGKCPHCGSDNIDKTRSSLLVEWLRIIRVNKPNFGIYENVKNIVGKEFKETTFKLFETELQEYGYNTHWKVLNSRNYGVAQNRERVYLLIIKKELDNGKFEFPEIHNKEANILDILEENVDDKFYINEEKTLSLLRQLNDKHILQDKTQLISVKNKANDFVKEVDVCGTLLARDYKGFGNQEMNAVVEYIKIPQATKQGYIECEIPGVADLSFPDSKTRRGRVQRNGKICPTLLAGQQDLCLIESIHRIRRLTPREYFRLMTFTDTDFDKAKASGMSDTQLYKQAGNSIVVNVLFEILLELYSTMPYLFDNLTVGSFFSGIGAFEKALDMVYEYINNRAVAVND